MYTYYLFWFVRSTWYRTLLKCLFILIKYRSHFPNNPNSQFQFSISQEMKKFAYHFSSNVQIQNQIFKISNSIFKDRFDIWILKLKFEYFKTMLPDWSKSAVLNLFFFARTSLGRYLSLISQIPTTIMSRYRISIPRLMCTTDF